MIEISFDTIIEKIEKENENFSDKSMFSTLTLPPKIIGREKQAEGILRHLLGYKQGFIAPLISVYGGSGTGKTTLTRYVCENLEEIMPCYVNLRKIKTVFGAANLLLIQLGRKPFSNSRGLNDIPTDLENAIQKKLVAEKKKVIVIILDEIDVIFSDTHGDPSDFLYKLVLIEENLKQKGFLLSLITVSNYLISDYDLDERVRSRICNSEVYFEPYSEDDLMKILHDRVEKGFSRKIPQNVLHLVASLSAEEHGDARRAIDLLRVAAELAGGNNITSFDVEIAHEKLQKDRIVEVISSISYHKKLLCSCIARMVYATGKDRHLTSEIYKMYCNAIDKAKKPLTYRRIAQLLTDLENSGIVVSRTLHKGRHGFAREYILTTSADIVGTACLTKWGWKLVTNMFEINNERIQHVTSPIEKKSKLQEWEDRLNAMLQTYLKNEYK